MWHAVFDLLFELEMSSNGMKRYSLSCEVLSIGQRCSEQAVKHSHHVCLSNILAAHGHRAGEIESVLSEARPSTFVCVQKRQNHGLSVNERVTGGLENL